MPSGVSKSLKSRAFPVLALTALAATAPGTIAQVHAGRVGGILEGARNRPSNPSPPPRRVDPFPRHRIGNPVATAESESEPAEPAPWPPRIDFEASLRIGWVAKADGAWNARVRAAANGIGLDAGDQAYYDDGEMKEQLHVWHALATAEFHEGSFHLRPGVGAVGVQGTGSSGFGVGFGTDARYDFAEHFGVEAQSLLLVASNLSGVQVSGAVGAGVFRFGYRAVFFDVGKPLYGPEIGVTLRY